MDLCIPELTTLNGTIGLTRPRGGALSPIRNQRTSVEVVSSVKIRVFDLVLWLRSPIGRDRGLKILPVWVRIPLELPIVSIILSSFQRQSGKTLGVSDRRI